MNKSEHFFFIFQCSREQSEHCRHPADAITLHLINDNCIVHKYKVELGGRGNKPLYTPPPLLLPLKKSDNIMHYSYHVTNLNINIRCWSSRSTIIWFLLLNINTRFTARCRWCITIACFRTGFLGAWLYSNSWILLLIRIVKKYALFFFIHKFFTTFF